MSFSVYRQILRLTKSQIAGRAHKKAIQAQGLRCFATDVVETKRFTDPEFLEEVKKPFTNVPLAKDLFLGRFDPVSLSKG